MDRAPAFVLTGGGTGGHLTPGLAVAEALRRRVPGCRVVFVGSDRPIDRLMLADEERRVIPIEPLRSAWRHPWRFMTAHGRAWRISNNLMAELAPSAVCGLGGLASLTTLYAAHRAGIPTFVLEQNVIPGRANRFVAKSVTALCTSFDETNKLLAKSVRIVKTGNPVRSQIARLVREKGHKIERRKTILVLGGSQGAKPLNEAILRILESPGETWKNYHWVHQTGPGTSPPLTAGHSETQRVPPGDSEPSLAAAYARAGLSFEIAPFFNDLAARLPNASLAVSRAGATTLAELACAATPAVLIPYPHATDRHQEANALVYARGGAAVMVAQTASAADFSAQLAATLNSLLRDPPRLQAMSAAMRKLAAPDAADEVVDLLLQGGPRR